MAIKRYEQEDYGLSAQQKAALANAYTTAPANTVNGKTSTVVPETQRNAALANAYITTPGNAVEGSTAAALPGKQQTNPNNQNGINPKGIVRTGTTANKQATATQPAQEALQSYQTLKPQDYESKYTQQLDTILNQIQNPEQFRWDFNGDELFKYYADLYSQKGRQASMNAMGQAAALTGGYGNSYAQQVGQQTYDDYMLGLYDKGMEMRDDAWNRYVYGQDQLMDQYNLLMNTDQTEYGRYRDTVSDWQNDRDYNYNLAMNILAKGQMPSDAMLAAAGLTTADAKKLMAKKSSGGGGTGSKKSTTYYTNVDGNLYTVENGKMVQADPSKVTDKDVIDHSIENTQKSMINNGVYGQTLMANNILNELNKNKK